MCHVYWQVPPISACQVIWAYALFIVFEGHICIWHMFCSSMVNKWCSLLIFDERVQ